MITQLEIKNFRGFSEYKIEDVGQVNLLVGTNNCGKTSILEAVHLLKSQGNQQNLASVLLYRGEQIQTETKEHDKVIYADLRRLFHGFRLTPQSKFTIIAYDKKIKETSFDQTERLSIYMKLSNEPGLFDLTLGATEHYQLYGEWKNGEARKNWLIFINEDGGLITAPHNISVPDNFFEKEDDTRDATSEFLYSSSLSTKELVVMFEKIVLTPEEDLVLDAVRIIEPEIIRLASLGGSSLSYGDHTRGGIIVKSSKWEERIPIGSFGDGIWRLLGLILSLVAAKNGTLLIDEIDTGLHHTVLSKMWKLICTTARKLNVQVFATTHSSDCWKTLADNAVEEEFADMPIRIHRINKDKESAVTFTNREMHLALNRELEVR
jgi:hypothetical protein